MDEEDELEESPDEDDKTPEQLKLETEFEALYNKHVKKIEEQLNIAAKAISKAEELSEKYGIPFYAGVSPLSQSYTPGSLDEDLDKDFISDLTGIYPGEYEGWEHSAVC